MRDEDWELMGDDLPEEEPEEPRPERRWHNEPETCPNCGRKVDNSNPMVSNMRCRECQSMQSLAGEIFLLDGKNPISTILGWLFGIGK
ncbi:MAG: hypothetical protein ABSE06_01285 [Anaerolineaceae bacterium]|jgi:transposase